MKDHRVRFVGRRANECPLGETFHEFLLRLVKMEFGDEWWERQRITPEIDRHPVANWFDLCEQQRRIDMETSTNSDQREEPETPGPVWATLMLGYDFYCVLSRLTLTSGFMDRLRKRNSFQAARYELAVAAIMLRAGFGVRRIDETGSKTCEFMARHSLMGLEIAVEAKSRIRRGMLAQTGQFQIQGNDARALADLLRRARSQAPHGTPYFVFIDLNVPASPGASLHRTLYVQQVSGFLGRLTRVSRARPEKFNAIFTTNFAYYSDPMDRGVSPPEFAVSIPQHCVNPLPDPRVIHLIRYVLAHYDRVPTEV